MKLNKKDLVDSIAEKAGTTKKDARAALNATIETIQESLSNGDAVGLVGFGTFLVRERAAREGRNPQTGEPMDRRRAPASVSRAYAGTRIL